ncbi:MAG: NADH-quinone oxidoreductase subunit J [Candidatus Marinimicrobia bacterium]|nr:NADH-quinone oxidoreductase subunit J [Candidatus Neomarinimicrobiota bacterium]
MATVTFWLIILLTVFSAVVVVGSSQLIYSAVALLFTFIGVAGLYIFLWADFIGVVQIVIYVGGILILVIFGIMLTNKITSVRISHTSVQRGAGAAVVFILFILLVTMILKTPWLEIAAVEPDQTVASIGKMLMIDYLLPFEITSVLLLGALIGAAMLARRGR